MVHEPKVHSKKSLLAYEVTRKWCGARALQIGFKFDPWTLQSTNYVETILKQNPSFKCPAQAMNWNGPSELKKNV